MGKRLIVLSLLFFALGFVSDRILFRTPAVSAPVSYAVRRQTQLKLVSPLLRCETSLTVNDAETRKLNGIIQSYVTEAQTAGEAKNISVYFRDPNIGNWFAINGEEKYTPASLLKVAAMMTYFKAAETKPEIMDEKIKFDGPVTADYNIAPLETLTAGQTYTVGDLVTRMIDHSDNDAKDLLLKRVTDEEFKKVFDDVRVDLPNFSEVENFMTVKNYVSFFRTLYNASYLNDVMSEKALEIMTNGDFRAGLVAGVPAGISVSHKFGERYYLPDGTKQLHDCGVVYHPVHPYILCVMTRGDSFEKLSRVIQKVSALTYQAVSFPQGGN